MAKKTKQEILKEIQDKDQKKKDDEDRKKAMVIQKDIVRKRLEKEDQEKRFWGEDGQTHHFEQVGLFIFIHVMIFYSIPFLEQFLYDYSIDHIKYIKDIKTPFSDSVMQVFSILGIGEFWFFLMVFFWGFQWKNENSFESRYFMTFMLISYDISIFFMFVYKTYFHASRPYFDDIALADTNLVESCSGEFGNPSGHAIVSAQCGLALYFYFTNYKFEEYFEKNKALKYFIGFIVISSIFVLMYSRVYSGRHTFDQVLLGFILGLVNTYFADYYYRETLYKTNFNLQIPQSHTF